MFRKTAVLEPSLILWFQGTLPLVMQIFKDKVKLKNIEQK